MMLALLLLCLTRYILNLLSQMTAISGALSLGSCFKSQAGAWKDCASETSVIHSHFMFTFAWCFSIASISGPSSRQKQILASLLYNRLTCLTPNSSVGAAHNSFKFSSLKGTLWTSKNTGIYERISATRI
jgi:hypothetical protein